MKKNNWKQWVQYINNEKHLQTQLRLYYKNIPRYSDKRYSERLKKTKSNTVIENAMRNP